jgi:hypothetical protein
MIIEDTSVNFRLFITNSEYVVPNLVILNNMIDRVITDNTSFVKADTYIQPNNVIGNSVISQQWFYTTFPDNKKMAKHTYTISTYRDNTLSNKIGEITFCANLLDRGENGVIIEGEGEGFGELLNVQILFVQSADGIYDKIHKVLLLNFLLMGMNVFYFVKKY